MLKIFKRLGINAVNVICNSFYQYSVKCTLCSLKVFICNYRSILIFLVWVLFFLWSFRLWNIVKLTSHILGWKMGTSLGVRYILKQLWDSILITSYHPLKATWNVSCIPHHAHLSEEMNIPMWFMYWLLHWTDPRDNNCKGLWQWYITLSITGLCPLSDIPNTVF